MEEYSKKVCLCGDPGVGKTSLIRRFVVGKYDEKYLSTLGTVISKKSVVVRERNCAVNMMIWDVSGQAEFKRIQRTAFRDAAAVLVVYDLTRPETRNRVKNWLVMAEEAAGGVPTMVIGNKSDLVDDSAKLSGDTLLDRRHIVTSARSGENIESAFSWMARDIVAHPTVGASVKRFTPDEPDSVPETIANSNELLDYFALSFCSTISDQELGMNILRKQVADGKMDFQRIKRGDAEALVAKLGDVVKDFRGSGEAITMRVKLQKAIERTKW